LSPEPSISGFGMVRMLLIITRYTMNLQRYITMRHLDKMARSPC